MILVTTFGISFLFNICSANWQVPSDSEPAVDQDGLKNFYWIQQPVDHFNPEDNRTWTMKFQIKHLHAKPNGPIFLATMKQRGISRMSYELALKTNGIAVAPMTQRYYKRNMPLDASSPDYFKYYTTKQMLADLVNLIKFLKTNPMFKESKVVAIDCSLGSILAVWLRQQYPQYCDMVIADSAHLLAKFEVPEYLEFCSDWYKKYVQPECTNKIVNYFTRMDDLLNTPSGIEEFRKEHKVCETVDLTDQLNQHRYIYKAVESALNSDVICRTTEENTHSLNKACQNETFEEVVQYTYNSTSLLTANYMYCNEFGWFITSSQNQIFSKRLVKDYYVKWCERLYGFTVKDLQQKMEETNRIYGGLTPNVTRVFFVYASEDPYLSLGVTKSLSPDAPAIVIDDFYPDNFVNYFMATEAVKKAIKQVTETLLKWLES